ncbi:CGEA protein [Bacillus pseudomycoides]|uniref:CGEA protein n=1 Tax=Bacillus bingmayongensis TaxID=1150157 RepID=A0ABU5K5Z7_9BACI|nr:CGEA protein [Bacillus pseudomycoides]
MASCSGVACFLFNSFPPGTVVTITTRSGQIIGPVSLVAYLPLPSLNCLVIFEEETSITPPSTSLIFISCEDIESVTTSPDLIDTLKDLQLPHIH